MRCDQSVKHAKSVALMQSTDCCRFDALVWEFGDALNLSIGPTML